MIGLSKTIVSTLLGNTGITDLTSTEIYHIQRDNNANSFPFIIVKQSDTNGIYTKDFYSYDLASFGIICVADTHNEMIALSQLVREALEFKILTDNTYTITSIQVEGFSENIQDNLYTGALSFTCKTFKQ